MRGNSKPKTKRSFAKSFRRDLPFYLFASPWIIGMLVFFIYPAIMSFYYSLCNYNIVSEPEFEGMKNYVILFTKDTVFQKAIINTLYMVFISLPLQLGNL